MIETKNEHYEELILPKPFLYIKPVLFNGFELRHMSNFSAIMLVTLKANPSNSIKARKRQKGRRTNLLERANKRDMDYN